MRDLDLSALPLDIDASLDTASRSRMAKRIRAMQQATFREQFGRMADRMLSISDADGDGRLSREEYGAYAAWETKRRDPREGATHTAVRDEL